MRGINILGVSLLSLMAVLGALLWARPANKVVRASTAYSRARTKSAEPLSREDASVSSKGGTEPTMPDSVGHAKVGVTDTLLMDQAALRRLIPTLTDPEELHAALYALARTLNPSDEDVDLFLQALARSQDEGVIKTALWGLGMRQDRIPVSLVATYITGDARPEVRRAALQTIGTLEDSEARRIVFQAARFDQDPSVRNAAVFFLPREKSAEESYIQALSRETHPKVRGAWVNLLGTVRTERSRRLLTDLVFSPTEEESVRREAVEALALSGDRPFMESLTQNAALPESLRALAAKQVSALAKGAGDPGSVQ